MHSKSNIKFTPYNNANEVVDEPFESLLPRYQCNLETSMDRHEFIFDAVQLMYYKCCRVIEFIYKFSGWIKKTNNKSKNKDDKYFQCTVMVASSYEEIKWNPERVSNIKAFINKYKWKGINYSPKIDD